MQPFATPAEDIRLRDACRVQSMGRAVEFSPESRAELESLFTRYPTKQAALLPALWIAQRDFGWISTEVIEMVSGLMELPPSHVYGVVSFYTMYNRSPKGRYHLQLCTNISCQLMGAEHILDCLREKLGIELGGTTADGMFSLDEVECLAACEMAPMIQVNDEFVGPLTPESALAMVDRLRAGRGEPRAQEATARKGGGADPGGGQRADGGAAPPVGGLPGPAGGRPDEKGSGNGKPSSGGGA